MSNGYTTVVICALNTATKGTIAALLISGKHEKFPPFSVFNGTYNGRFVRHE